MSDICSSASRLVLPADYGGIQVVDSLEALVSTPMVNGVNAICWERSLRGDFGELVDKLPKEAGISSVADDQLVALALSVEGRVARDVVMQDLALLRGNGLEPELNRIDGYVEEEGDSPMPTNVRSWHVDSATVPLDTYLCTYWGASSEGLPNDQAQRRVDDPQTRAELLRYYGGEDDDEFLAFLDDYFFSLHYQPLAGAVPYVFGIGNLWRVATLCPGSDVPPCIHRAPNSQGPGSTRLLLLS